MDTIIGDIYDKENSFEWKIKKFTSLSTEPGNCYASPSFNFYGAKFCIRIFPNGWSNSFIEYISISLKKLSFQQTNHTIFHKISIKRNDGTDFAFYNCTKIFSNQNSIAWGRNDFLKRSDLLAEIQNVTSDGVLTIGCCIRLVQYTDEAKVSGKNDANLQESPILWKSLVRNMKDSFLKQKNCDVVIKVKDEDFPAHKMILESRSKVFEAMFEHDTLEKRNNFVEINDAEPHVFRDFLLYLYCGEVENLSSENVCGLYALSDKYNMEDLKTECVKFMESNMSVETVCDVLFLTDRYGETKLNELGKSFVLKNLEAVLTSDQWKNFEEESNMLPYKILKSIMLDKVTKLNLR